MQFKKHVCCGCAAGANLTANLRDFFTRGKLGGKGKRQEEQDLGGFGGGGEQHPGTGSWTGAVGLVAADT